MVAAAVGAGVAIAVIPATPAWACSCGETDPAMQVTMAITDSRVAEVANPWGGGGDSWDTTVDLRGASSSVIGAMPAALEGTDLAAVPVLASVIEDPDMEDSCNTPHRPDAGSDIELTGVLYDEGEGVFVYTGPCNGSFIVVAAPDEGYGGGTGDGRGLLVPAVVGGVGVVALGLVGGRALARRRGDA